MRNLLHSVFLVASGILAIFKCASSGGSSSGITSPSRRLETFSSRYTLPSHEPLPFTFGYRFTDDYGTMQTREEKTDPNGAKTGSYSFMDASGTYRHVDYIADSQGFRATVRTNEPGTIPAEPAHVSVQTPGEPNFGGPQPIRNAPQLEYSSHVLSRYNFSGHSPGRNHPVPQGGFQRENSFLNEEPFFGGGFPESNFFPQKQAFKNENFFKGSNFPGRQPLRDIVIPEAEFGSPHGYPDPERLTEKFFGKSDAGPEFTFGNKIPNFEYNNNHNNPTFSLIPPTRNPRRHRDSRPRSKFGRHQYKVHVPRGFENYPNLPLYRDK